MGTGFPRDKREAFARRSCSNKKIEQDDDSKKSHPALGTRSPLLHIHDMLESILMFAALSDVRILQREQGFGQQLALRYFGWSYRLQRSIRHANFAGRESGVTIAREIAKIKYADTGPI